MQPWEEKGRAQGALTPLLLAATASSPLRGAPKSIGEEQPWASKARCSGNTLARYGKSGGQNPSRAHTAHANFFMALQEMCVHSPQHSWEGPEPQMAICLLRAASFTSLPPLSVMNFLCGILLRPQKLVSAPQFGWGLLFASRGGALERPLPSSGQLRTLTFDVSYQVEHNKALSCGVYN